MASVVSEYISILSKYSKLYGDDTVVLMQVGSFYEMYGVDNDHEKVGNVAEISKLLNMVLTKRNKRISDNSRTNPMMLGFPCLALNKYIPILLEEDYTIIIVDQIKTGLSIKRVVADVISASTYINADNDEYIVLIYVDLSAGRNQSFHVGLSAINVVTGKSAVHECHSAQDDNKLPLDDAISFVQQYRPREIVLASNYDQEELAGCDLISYLGLSQKVKYSHRCVNKIASNVEYQNTVLGNVYDNNTMLSNIEFLDLECRHFAVISYVLLIEYIYAHNPMLIKKISVPYICIPYNHLVLATNTIEQLDLVPSKSVSSRSKRITSVFNVINQCVTSVGRRLLKARLLSPIFDPIKLEERYALIDEYGSICVFKSDNIIGRLLSKIADVERLQRRMSLGIMSPAELLSINTSYVVILEIQKQINDQLSTRGSMEESLSGSCTTLRQIMLSDSDCKQAHEFIEKCNATFHMDNLLFHDIDNISPLAGPLFCKGIFDDIDDLESKIQCELSSIQDIADTLSTYLANTTVKSRLSPRKNTPSKGPYGNGGEESNFQRTDEIDKSEPSPGPYGVRGDVRVDYMQNNGYYIVTSNARANKLSKDASFLKSIGGLSFKSGNATTRITSNKIDAANKNISELLSVLRIRSKEYYTNTLSYLYMQYNSTFSRLLLYVSELDVIRSHYKTSVMYGYCRPIVCLENNHSESPSGSFIKASGLRHPIIERIDNGIEYVPNDIYIGDDHNGMVLYSMNSGGKTSLLKACGISLILAQMGSFVPASSYYFSPFNKIMTRIISEDSVFKGRSSFVAEMYELRSILKRADAKTIVLADEITHGTEHTSGSAIFTSSVITLAERKVNFMFTTHLHNVYNFIKDIANVRVCHLSVFIRDGKVLFERKLNDGPCDSVYGLEVCESLNMDIDFIARAFKIRDTIEDKRTNRISPLNIKKSRYNSNKLIQLCQVCNYSPRQNSDVPLDVHHIKQKCTGDNAGLIGSVHKDAKSNLVALCKECHIKVHNGTIIIDGYIDTSNGVKLEAKLI